MYCKDCKAQIPDGVKYCPECGALIQEPVAAGQQQAPYTGYSNQQFDPGVSSAPQQPAYNQQPVYNGQQPTYNGSQQPPIYNGPQQPVQQQKKKSKIPGIIISIVVMVAVSLASSYFYSNRPGTGDAPSNDYESIAVGFVDNFLSKNDVNSFKNDTAIDFIELYDDMIDYYCTTYAVTREEYLAALSDTYMKVITDAETLLQYDFDYLFETTDDLITEEFGSNTISCSVADSEELTDEDLSYYYNKINDYLSPMGLSVDNYIDRSAVTEAYKIDVEMVVDGSKTSDEYTNIDNFYVTVVKYNDGYRVIYDDYMIEMLMDLMYEEE